MHLACKKEEVHTNLGIETRSVREWKQKRKQITFDKL